ncbi:VOC family protein [Ruegeria sp. HKCCD8929]|uniref:VOC family protein n=1 Tax=Ruegeria sp. HKCCD8929 TaxID=2683006 RepID=UPI001487CCD7|nr:VOC family protein [Ruegeria sp. HKCCD8929]
MEFHKGRLVDHIHLRVSDLQNSQRFYEGVLKSLGRDLTLVTEEFFIADELFVSQSEETPSRIHLAFQAEDQDQVRAFHRAALAHGGTDNGGPGERPYHPGYFAAYALDPDGNNIEAVYHGPAERSAASVILTVT